LPGLRPERPRSDRSPGFFLYGLSEDGGLEDVEESLPPPEFLDLFRQHRQPRLRRLKLSIPGGELRRENLVRRFQLGDPGA